jgi:hypothetical protein
MIESVLTLHRHMFHSYFAFVRFILATIFNTRAKKTQMTLLRKQAADKKKNDNNVERK